MTDGNIKNVTGDYMKNMGDLNSVIKNDKEDAPVRSIREHSMHVGDMPIGTQRTSSKHQGDVVPFSPQCLLASGEMSAHIFNKEKCHFNLDVEKDVGESPEDIVLMPEYQNKEKLEMRPCGTSIPLNNSFPEVQVLLPSHVPGVVPTSTPAVTREGATQYSVRSRILSRWFSFNNSQIVVLIASIIISLVLIIYIFV